jgi:hypothetical protein
MLIALFFYYQNEKTLYLDLVKSNMQNTQKEYTTLDDTLQDMDGMF